MGQLIGVIIGWVFSPTWLLMRYVMKDYFNVDAALQSPQQMVSEFFHFNMLVAQNPHDVAQHLLPGMVMVLVVSCLFVALCSYMGSWMANNVAHRWSLGKPSA
jgi:hypothetical protein